MCKTHNRWTHQLTVLNAKGSELQVEIRHIAVLGWVLTDKLQHTHYQCKYNNRQQC